MRTPEQDQFVKFNYYLGIVQNMAAKQAAQIAVLVENGYENPVAVVSEVIEFLAAHHPGRD